MQRKLSEITKIKYLGLRIIVESILNFMLMVSIYLVRENGK